MQKKIVFQPMGIVVGIEEDETILQAAQKSGVYIQATCGAQKVCGKCRIKIVEGNVSAQTDREKTFFTAKEIEEHYRLACVTQVKSDAVIEIPKESRKNDEVVLKEGKEKTVELKLAVKSYYVALNKATLVDNKDDTRRLKEALVSKYSDLPEDLDIDLQVLKQLPKILRTADWCVTVSILYDKKIIKVTEGCNRVNYGIAIDVGTTTIAAYLCHLEDGKMKQSAAMMNPQIRYGDDVLTRVSHCVNNEGGVEQLQKLLLEGLNELTQEMIEKEGIIASDVVEAVIVFNTVMQHIALGISPEYIGKAPFAAAFAQPLDLTAKEFGLHILPSGNIHCLPSEAGFMGGDNVAVLIAEEPYLQEKIKLIIDIGTNSEICLGNKNKLYTTSCATGPALEGAQIKCGMRAAKGAIEGVEINPLTLEPKLRIIGGKEKATPIGICGSGILDVVAQMAITGIIEPDGKFSKHIQSKRLRLGEDGKKEYVLYAKKEESERDITVTQKDVRAVQLAKAALYAGAKTLMNHSGIKVIDEIILAGAFGSYIDKKNALLLGLYPDCHLDQVTVVGNAAGIGARLALINKDKRKEAKEIARNIEYVETATNSDYQKLFAEAMAIPHANHSFSINQSPIWECQGADYREISQEIIALGIRAFEDKELMEKAILSNQMTQKEDHLTFPLMQKIEALVYGGKPKCVGRNYIISEYPYQYIEDIDQNQSILEHPIIQNTLACISKHADKKIVLEVTGPFSILATLIDPIQLYRLKGEDKKLLLNLLEGITDALAEYTVEAIKRGIDIISFADPEGVMELVGTKVYKALSGAAVYAYFNKIEAYLDKTLVHICGKTSYSLQKAGFITTKVYRVKENKTYMGLLFEYAQDKKFKFVGHSCMHTKRLAIPIINKLELVHNCGKGGE